MFEIITSLATMVIFFIQKFVFFPEIPPDSFFMFYMIAIAFVSLNRFTCGELS